MTTTDSNFAQPHFGEIPLQNVIPSPTNPRKHFDEVALAELAESIKTLGLAQPILVRPLPTTEQQIDCVEIVCGERRYRASKLAGKTHIMAVCKEMTDAEVLKLQLIENLQRQDVHPIEEAEGYERLMTDLKISAVQIAQEVGKSREYIYGRLKLCALTPANRTLFYAGKLDASTALLVARIPVTKLQDQAGAEIEDMSVRQAKNHITSRYTLGLDKARFDIKDAKLVKSAGACTKCPKRTGAQPEIYTDLSADVCTDPDCFESKNKALADKTRQTTTKATAHVLTERHGERSAASTKRKEIAGGITAASDSEGEQHSPETSDVRGIAMERENKVRLEVYMSIRARTESQATLLRCIVKSMLTDYPLPIGRIEYSFDTSSDEAIRAHIDQMTDVQDLITLISDITFGYALNTKTWDVTANGTVDLDTQSYIDLATTAHAFGIDIDQIRENHKPVVAEAKSKGKASKKTKAAKVVEPEPEYPADESESKFNTTNPKINPAAAWPFPTAAEMAEKEAA